MSTRRRTTWVPTLVKLAVIALAIVIANVGTSWIIDRLDIQIWPQHMEIVDRAVLICMIAYIVLMATPFIPGIEIGLLLMAMLGPKGVLVTYVCTVVALTIAFCIGRLLSAGPLITLLRWLRLERAANLLERFDVTPPAKRLEFLAEEAPARVVPTLVRRRYLLLMLLLNVPGNALIGGGGGIAMMAGLSRLYSFPLYLLAISIAVLPGPIVVMLTKSFP